MIAKNWQVRTIAKNPIKTSYPGNVKRQLTEMIDQNSLMSIVLIHVISNVQVSYHDILCFFSIICLVIIFDFYTSSNYLKHFLLQISEYQEKTMQIGGIRAKAISSILIRRVKSQQAPFQKFHCQIIPQQIVTIFQEKGYLLDLYQYPTLQHCLPLRAMKRRTVIHYDLNFIIAIYKYVKI